MNYARNLSLEQADRAIDERKISSMTEDRERIATLTRERDRALAALVDVTAEAEGLRRAAQEAPALQDHEAQQRAEQAAQVIAELRDDLLDARVMLAEANHQEHAMCGAAIRARDHIGIGEYERAYSILNSALKGVGIPATSPRAHLAELALNLLEAQEQYAAELERAPGALFGSHAAAQAAARIFAADAAYVAARDAAKAGV